MGKHQARENKANLLEMCRKGLPKPLKPDALAGRLAAYISPSSASYDPEFIKQLHEVNEKANNNWFDHGLTKPSKENKANLLEMCRKGEQRPDWATKTGRALARYIYPRARSYDPEFIKQLHEVNEKANNNWFDRRADHAKENKAHLLKMCKEGEPKPDCASRLGYSLTGYIAPSSEGYDPDFLTQLQSANQQANNNWFDRSRAIWETLIADIEFRLVNNIPLNKGQLIRLTRCLLNPNDPYFSSRFYREFEASARQYLERNKGG